MPNVGPPVIPAFISAVAACTYSVGGYFVDNATGAHLYCHTASGAAWTLSASGLPIKGADAALLMGATANADGSFATAAGVSYWLAVGDVAHAVPK